MWALRTEMTATDVDEVIRKGLHEYLDTLQTKMNAVDDSLLRDFFVWRPDLTLSAGVPQ
jgi:uncharacterized alpha-E superfamily protein